MSEQRQGFSAVPSAQCSVSVLLRARLEGPPEQPGQGDQDAHADEDGLEDHPVRGDGQPEGDDDRVVRGAGQVDLVGGELAGVAGWAEVVEACLAAV